MQVETGRARERQRTQGWWRSIALIVVPLLAAMPVLAQSPADAAAPPSLSMTTNLVRLMVKRGLISQAEADELFRQAEAETRRAEAAVAARPAAPPVAEGTQRVPYVSPSLRAEIKQEVKDDVLATARAEGWAAPGAVKDWVGAVTISGDVRMRVASAFLDSGNVPGAILDVGNFNATGPFDINLATNPTAFPTFNSTEDRAGRFIIRARLNVAADVADWASVGLRLASGQTDSPVSTNTLLGTNFTKKGIWLDLAYIDLHPTPYGGLSLGRIPNPYTTFLTEAPGLIFDSDLNFEGAALRGQSNGLIDQRLSLNAVAGAFPLDYTAADFPANVDAKASDRNKWLLGGQVTGRWAFSDETSLGLGVGYFSFQNIQASLSDPCATYLLARQCSSDQTRPAFVQKGNTVFPIRQIVANPADPNFIITPIPQFLGLAFDYDLLYLRGDLKVKTGDRYVASLGGEFVKNLGYRPEDACRFGAGTSPFTNVQPGSRANGTVITDLCAPLASGDTAPELLGGDTGWQVSGTFGVPKIERLWDWSVTAGYRYLETDAVPDGFTDSDFGLGGTNARGYFLSGTLGLHRNANVQARWLSSREVSGPNYAVDTLFFDLNLGF